MTKDMMEMVESWHRKLGDQADSARIARDALKKAEKPEQAAMLAGKVKAYVNMRCYLESKYGKCMPHLLENRQQEQE